MNIISDYDNFFLPANNLDTAKEFYKNKLGLDIKFDFADKGMTAFKVGDNEPAIIVVICKMPHLQSGSRLTMLDKHMKH